jgi:hypothetical protein
LAQQIKHFGQPHIPASEMCIMLSASLEAPRKARQRFTRSPSKTLLGNFSRVARDCSLGLPLSIWFQLSGVLILAEVPRAPPAEVLVRKIEKLIDALWLRGFQPLDPLPEGILVAIQLDQRVPRETRG